MKTKIIIPFHLDTAKKIQAGELKGEIKTQDGKNVRIVCWDKKGYDCPILGLITTFNDTETTCIYTNNGKCHLGNDVSAYDLVLEVPDTEPQFKPFDRVLVRNYDDQKWQINLFSDLVVDGSFPYVCMDGMYKQCIPFEGNQDLLGTTKY